MGNNGLPSSHAHGGKPVSLHAKAHQHITNQLGASLGQGNQGDVAVGGGGFLRLGTGDVVGMSLDADAVVRKFVQNLGDALDNLDVVVYGIFESCFNKFTKLNISSLSVFKTAFVI